MKKTLALMLIFSLCMPFHAFAADSQGKSQEVTVKCEGCEKDRFPMGRGGGRSSNPNDSGAVGMLNNNQAYEEAAEKIGEAFEKAANQENDDLIRQLKDCISGINRNVFSGDFSHILDQILQAIMSAVCNFAKQQSQRYLNQALNALTFDLPYGAGTVGATTTVLGYHVGSVGTTNSLNDMDLTVNSSSAGPQANAGYTMFKKGGSILLDQNGDLVDNGGSMNARPIFNGIF